MKLLEITTNKRLLIVELLENADINDSIEVLKIGNQNYIVYSRFNGNVITKEKFSHDKVKPICTGSDLTEEIAAGMVEKYEYPMSREILGFEDYLNKGYDMKNTALRSFISAIEAQGWYWGRNPLGHSAEYYSYIGNEKNWQDAESRTFHPEKCIIFEIVE